MKRKIVNEIDRNMVIAYIKRLEVGKKLYTVEVLQKNPNRTISQNSLYWLFLTCIEEETGNNRDDLHDIFKYKFILPKEVNIFGEKIMKWTTTDKDTLQFKQYLDKIQIFASTELSITLPNPEDKYWQEFFEYYIAKL
jgi:hypothetical protein